MNEGTKNVYGEPVMDAPKRDIVADYGPAKSQPNPGKPGSSGIRPK